MSVESLILLLIFVALPLLEWIGRLVRTREAERQRRDLSSLPREPGVPSQRTPARDRTLEDDVAPVRPAPPMQPMRPKPRAPVPARTAVPPRPAAPAPSPARAAATPRSTRRRLDRLGLRGPAALRRAVVIRAILGPCAGCRPPRAGHADA